MERIPKVMNILLLFVLFSSQSIAAEMCEFMGESYSGFNLKKLRISSPEYEHIEYLNFYKLFNSLKRDRHYSTYKINDLFDRIKGFEKQYEKDSVKLEKIRVMRSSIKPFPKFFLANLYELVEMKHGPSLFCMGHAYYYGYGVSPDYVQAWAWYTAAKYETGLLSGQNKDSAWSKLDSNSQLLAEKYADKYVKLYTNVPNRPAAVMIK